MRMAILAVLLLVLAGCGGATGNVVNPWQSGAAEETPAQVEPAPVEPPVVEEVPVEEPIIEDAPVVEDVPVPEEPVPETPVEVVPEQDPLLNVPLLKGTNFSVWYPKENMTIKGPILSLSLKAVNFSIGKMSRLNLSKDNNLREGHFHVIFDYMNESEYIEMDDFSKTLKGLQAGDRTMRVVMVNNDHTPLGLERVVHFTVPQTGIDGTDEQSLYTSP